MSNEHLVFVACFFRTLLFVGHAACGWADGGRVVLLFIVTGIAVWQSRAGLHVGGCKMPNLKLNSVGTTFQSATWSRLSST